MFLGNIHATSKARAVAYRTEPNLLPCPSAVEGRAFNSMYAWQAAQDKTTTKFKAR